MVKSVGSLMFVNELLMRLTILCMCYWALGRRNLAKTSCKMAFKN